MVVELGLSTCRTAVRVKRTHPSLHTKATWQTARLRKEGSAFAQMGANASAEAELKEKEGEIERLKKQEAELKAKYDAKLKQLKQVDTSLQGAIMPRTLKDMEWLEGRRNLVRVHFGRPLYIH